MALLTSARPAGYPLYRPDLPEYRHTDLAMYRTLPTEVNVWGQGAAPRPIAELLRLKEAPTCFS